MWWLQCHLHTNCGSEKSPGRVFREILQKLFQSGLSIDFTKGLLEWSRKQHRMAGVSDLLQVTTGIANTNVFHVPAHFWAVSAGMRSPTERMKNWTLPAVESLNCGVAWVGREIKVHVIPHPWRGQGQLPPEPSNLALNHPRDGAAPGRMEIWWFQGFICFQNNLAVELFVKKPNRYLKDFFIIIF